MQPCYIHFVLMNISTHPIIVPIEDYCRDKNECLRSDIENNWKSFEQQKAQIDPNGNEIIKVYYDPKNWQFTI